MAAAVKKNNPLGLSVMSGARGKPPQLQAMLSTPGLYTDYKDRVIPSFVEKSFSEGIRPIDFLAGTFGTRKSVISTKRNTAMGGDYSKMLSQITSREVITEDDCGTRNGIDLDVNDDSLKGRVLARPVGDLPAGTVLDRQALAQLRKSNKGKVLARSPLTCDVGEGLCKSCVGAMGGGKLPSIGDHVGITASNSIGAPIAQAALNCIAEGTLVRMADFSEKPIEKVKVGEWVLGADLKANTFPVRVTGVWDQGIQPTQEYRYKMGQTGRHKTLQATEIHGVLQATKYTNTKLEELNHLPRLLPAGHKPGKPGAVLPQSYNGPGRREPLSLLFGYWLGDGIRYAPGSPDSPTLSCACLETADLLKRDINHLGLTINKNKRSHDWRVVGESYNCDRGGDGRFVGGVRNFLKKLLLKLDLVGLYCHEKIIPSEVWSWDSESCARLVAGFVMADGSVYKSGSTIGVSFGSTAKPMLTGLRALLETRFGIYTSAITKTSKAEDSPARKHDGWQFTITRRDQIKKFQKVIGPHLKGPKSKKLNSYILNADPGHYDSLPNYVARRVSSAPLGEKQCWDLTVDHKDHLFVLANGLIVSNTKHQSGMSAGAKKEFSGFDYISQFSQAPENFPEGAVLAEHEGKVTGIRDAEQGGKYVTVGDDEHYISPDFKILVSEGDQLEPGDQISDGLINPRDILRLRGLGSARRYYAERLNKLLEDSGAGGNMRNTEIIARAAMNHIRVDDPDSDDYLPDDVVTYNKFRVNYMPPEDAKDVDISNAEGKFLQKPTLHYSIGTRLTPKMIKRIRGAGYSSVAVSDKPALFEPVMSNLRRAGHVSDDWLAKQHTSYLAQNLVGSAVRGEDTNVEENVHFVPRLSIGKDFGKNVERTGKF
jgi:hypothetical protein